MLPRQVPRIHQVVGAKKKNGVFVADPNAVHQAVQLPKVGSAAASRGSQRMEPRKVEPAFRHLLYHIYPRRGGKWRSRILRIRESFPLFNGKKVIAIAFDGTTEHPVMVKDCLTGEDVTFIELRNNPERREVETFKPLFEAVAGIRGPEHATLYAHAKGVTRAKEHTAQRWVETIEEVYLDYWHVVGELLKKHPIVGAFKKSGQGWPPEWSLSDWHFAGSWFWFRNDQLFTQPDWSNIDEFWGGIEPYPSLHFRSDEVGTIFGWDAFTHVNLYVHDQWVAHVDPLVEKFRVQNRSRIPMPESTKLNVGCGPHYAEGWHNTDVFQDGTTTPDQVVSFERPFPFAAGTFDTAFCGHVLEHVPWDKVIPWLKQLQACCKSGSTVCVLGPDILKAFENNHGKKDKKGTLSHYVEIMEDSLHHQDNYEGKDIAGLRHWWNCYGQRVAEVMSGAGFKNVRILDINADELEAWPVVDRTNKDQCVVMGEVP